MFSQMSPYLLAILYSLPIVVVSLAGGWIPNFIEITHTKKQVFLAFVSGFMIGVATLHLLPHGIEQIASVHTDRSVQLGALCMVGGIAIMFGFMRLLSFHDHEPTSGTNNKQLTTRAGVATWITVVVGMCVHTLFEGFAIGAALGIEYVVLDLVTHDEIEAYNSTLALAVVFAIVLHKPFDALTVVGVMKYAGIKKKSLWLTNVGFALICPIGALLALFFLRELLHDYEHILGFLLAFIAGAFLCIALADLLPEAFRHRHDRFKIFVAFLYGALISCSFWFVTSLTPHMH